MSSNAAKSATDEDLSLPDGASASRRDSFVSSRWVSLMLQRVLEPEVMDSDREAVAYDEMDNVAVNRQFVLPHLVPG